jgi:hypothetical protein
MGTSLFLVLCLIGEVFLVYCLIHFTLELRVLDREARARPGAQNRRPPPFPEGRPVEGQFVQAHHRA